MTLYTRTGDDGITGLFGNARVPKADLRIEAYGTVDELNSCLGMVRSTELSREWDRRMGQIQSLLFDLGADLATPGSTRSVTALARGIQEIESWIDESEAQLPQLKTFVLPGGHEQAARFHLSRTVCRRAEREVWRLADREVGTDGAVAIEHGRYLNRLSDLLFSWARLANLKHRVADVPWTAAPQE